MGKRRTRHVLLPVLCQGAYDNKFGRWNTPRGKYAFEHEGQEANMNLRKTKMGHKTRFVFGHVYIHVIARFFFGLGLWGPRR